MLERRAQGRYRAELGRREKAFVLERDGSLLRDAVAVSFRD